jgi:hypothetical protein
MLARAADKAPRTRLVQADMRALPPLGPFDLVTCLDDALNYLLGPADLTAALAGIRRNLRPHGIAIWDVNTLAMYRSQFAHDRTTDHDGVLIAWRGETASALEAGGPARATVDVFAQAAGGLWERRSSVHSQRHWPDADVREIADAAGLTILAVLGQHPGAVLEPELDELVHSKAVYLACRDDRPGSTGLREEVTAVSIGSI